MTVMTIRLDRRSIGLILLTVTVLYIGSYAVNSYFGGYWLKPERDGHLRGHIGLSMHTAIMWQPGFGYYIQYDSNFFGMIYSPLVAFDRAWVHPTMYVTDDSTFDWINNTARASDIHPRFRTEFIRSRK